MEIAQKRYQVILCHQSYGIRAALKMSGKSKRTLGRWLAAFRIHGLPGLIPKSRRPHKVPSRNWPKVIHNEIRRLRMIHNNIGPTKLEPILEEFCVMRSLHPPSRSTIGRLIQDAGGMRSPTTRNSTWIRVK